MVWNATTYTSREKLLEQVVFIGAFAHLNAILFYSPMKSMSNCTHSAELVKCQIEKLCWHNSNSAKTARGTAMRELRGLQFTCSECHADNYTNVDNVIIHIYENQPIYNTIEFRCEHCCACMILFGMWEFIASANNDWVIERRQYADEDTIKGFAKVYFNDVLPEHKEAQVSFFHLVLEDIQDLADIDWGQDG